MSFNAFSSTLNPAQSIKSKITQKINSHPPSFTANITAVITAINLSLSDF